MLHALGTKLSMKQGNINPDFSFHFGCHAVSQHACTRSKMALQVQTIQVVINSKMNSTAKMKEILD